jgi:hypothetical protein
MEMRALNCRRAERLIGELSLAELRSPPPELAEHVAGCGGCARRLQEQVRLVQMLAAMPERRLSEAAWDRVAGGIHFGALAAGLAGARVVREPGGALSTVLAPLARRRLAGTLAYAALAAAIGIALGSWLCPRTRTVTVVRTVPEVRDRVVRVQVPVEVPVQVPVETVRWKTRTVYVGARRPQAAPQPTVSLRTSYHRVDIAPVKEEVRTWIAGDTVTAPGPPVRDETSPPAGRDDGSFRPDRLDGRPRAWALADFVVAP